MGLEKPEESLFMRLKEPFGKRSWLVETTGDVMGLGRDGGRFFGPLVEGGLFQPIWLLATGGFFVDAPRKTNE